MERVAGTERLKCSLGEAMGQRRNIDERDVDQLLAALSDRQIAELFGMSEMEVFDLRQSRRPKLPPARTQKNIYTKH
ncbi:MAG: shikimate kinase [Hyphomicrobiaceae bacterium]|jgi:shikimate kinase